LLGATLGATPGVTLDSTGVIGATGATLCGTSLGQYLTILLYFENPGKKFSMGHRTRSIG
jgi:hypothetical protein